MVKNLCASNALRTTADISRIRHDKSNCGIISSIVDTVETLERNRQTGCREGNVDSQSGYPELAANVLPAPAYGKNGVKWSKRKNIPVRVGNGVGNKKEGLYSFP